PTVKNRLKKPSTQRSKSGPAPEGAAHEGRSHNGAQVNLRKKEGLCLPDAGVGGHKLMLGPHYIGTSLQKAGGKIQGHLRGKDFFRRKLSAVNGAGVLA